MKERPAGFFKLFEPAKSTKFIRAFVDSDRSPPPDKRCTWWERPPDKVSPVALSVENGG